MIHKPYLQIFTPLILLVAFCLMLSGCKKEEDDKASQITGLWVQEKLTVDGVESVLPLEQQSLSLFFEANGVYRTFAKDMPTIKAHFGAWTISDNTWLEMTIDTWRLNSNQWAMNHIPVRFTIMTLTDNTLEIRVKTYTGERKYAALFIENVRPAITSENIDSIKQEYKSLETYIFTFKKVTN